MKIALKVTSGASPEDIGGWLGEYLKVRVTAPAENGRANAALKKLLAKQLSLPRGAIRIVSGAATARKVVEIDGLSEQELYQKLATDRPIMAANRTPRFDKSLGQHKPLPRSFYRQDTVAAACELLGKIVVRKIDGQMLSGIITETEAYRASDDPSSHAFRGMTPRNRPMFGQLGIAYVYFTYGMHYCLNVVARGKDFVAGAVLLRAIKPLRGIEQMLKNRNRETVQGLLNGPAKLTQALQISKEQSGIDLTKRGEIFIATGIKCEKIVSSERIGIRNGKEKLWNFRIELHDTELA